MTSFTGKINTNETYEKVADITSITFTSGKTYTMQIRGNAWLKVDNAEFFISNENLQYKASGSDLYIQTSSIGCSLTILEE